MNTTILASAFSLLLISCASSITPIKTNDASTSIAVIPEKFAEFPEPILRITSCDEHLLVVAGRSVWRLGVDGKMVIQLASLSADGVRTVYCISDDEMMILEASNLPPWKAFYRSSLKDDVFRQTTGYFLPSDHDFRRVSDHELLYSTFMYGQWYVGRGIVGPKRIDPAVLARGRFPISCGDECIFFVAEKNLGFEVRRLLGSVETGVQPLPNEIPMGLERLDDRFVIAYKDKLFWPADASTVVIPTGITQLLVWQNRLLIVSGNRLLKIGGANSSVAENLGTLRHTESMNPVFAERKHGRYAAPVLSQLP